MMFGGCCNRIVTGIYIGLVFLLSYYFFGGENIFQLILMKLKSIIMSIWDCGEMSDSIRILL